MLRKLALKRLTASDLTLFEYQFRIIGAGNQKAINLNRDIFIDHLYPNLATKTFGYSERLPLDLFIFGPGFGKVQNLQRKIIKGGTYKNWRLDGELVPSPLEDENRYRPLQPGDFAVFEFIGSSAPASAKIYLISMNSTEDKNLHSAFQVVLGENKMIALDEKDLEEAINNSNPSPDHPIHTLVLNSALEDAALFGKWGTETINRYSLGASLSLEDLQRARKAAENVGILGEEIINERPLQNPLR